MLCTMGAIDGPHPLNERLSTILCDMVLTLVADTSSTLYLLVYAFNTFGLFPNLYFWFY